MIPEMIPLTDASGIIFDLVGSMGRWAGNGRWQVMHSRSEGSELKEMRCSYWSH